MRGLVARLRVGMKCWLLGDGSYPYQYLNGKVIRSKRPILGARRGLLWAYTATGGGPVLRTEASWRTISGVVINTSRGAVWLYFRRGAW